MIEPGTTLCDIEIGASLDELVGRFSAPEYAGAEIELWVFDGRERREHAQEALRAYGVQAHVRSAYKPFVHVMLEELDLNNVKEIVIRYPVVQDVPRNRFLLESYPVAELLGECPTRFEPAEPVDGSQLLFYRLVLLHKDGTEKTIEVAAPNIFHTDHVGHRIFTNTGWVRVKVAKRPELDRDEPYRTDQEQAFDAVMATLAGQAWSEEGPYFDRLDLCVAAPFYDFPLPVGSECISTAEAMHEDLYFSALEVFKKARGLDLGDRTLMPGQLVPQIVTCEGPLRVQVKAGSDPSLEADRAVKASVLPNLDTADRWLDPAAIKAHLDDLGGDFFQVRSRRGRPVWSTHIDGPGPNLVVTAGQHANETSGPVGALRAARQLIDVGQAGFTVSPLVNPDGYALFREFCADYPHHMNHASRYTAAGCDLGHVGRGFENEAHHIGQEKTGAKLHLNLHGYPAHEWTRPFSGYVPRGLDPWTIPKGFFVILLYNPGWKDRGEVILNTVIDELAGYQPIVDLNRRQHERYRRYAADLALDTRKDIPYLIEETDDELFPLTIITEAPDETVYGEEFVVLHTAQMKAVLAAAEAGASVLS